MCWREYERPLAARVRRRAGCFAQGRAAVAATRSKSNLWREKGLAVHLCSLLFDCTSLGWLVRHILNPCTVFKNYGYPHSSATNAFSPRYWHKFKMCTVRGSRKYCTKAYFNIRYSTKNMLRLGFDSSNLKKQQLHIRRHIFPLGVHCSYTNYKRWKKSF